jgi:hypothetical protein
MKIFNLMVLAIGLLSFSGVTEARDHGSRGYNDRGSDYSDSYSRRGRGDRGRRGTVKCVAKNRRGARYVSRAPRKRMARRRAMRQCRQDSWRPGSCYIARCNRRGGGHSRW